eukprot:jgi/Chlat1/1624/Chrsp127S01943
MALRMHLGLQRCMLGAVAPLTTLTIPAKRASKGSFPSHIRSLSLVVSAKKDAKTTANNNSNNGNGNNTKIGDHDSTNSAAAAAAAGPYDGLKVLGVPGSLRKASTNKGLLREGFTTGSCIAAKYFPEGVVYEILDIMDVPLYNQDVEDAGVPEAVVTMKAKVAEADAILFATTEYNYSVAGPLKNCLDWASRAPNAWNDKPAAMMGSGGGLGTARSHRRVGELVNALLVWTLRVKPAPKPAKVEEPVVAKA